MVVELNSLVGHKGIGNKAKSLVDLNRYGFNIPKSIALDTTEYLNAISSVQVYIERILVNLNFDNIEDISDQIKSLFIDISLSEKMLDEVRDFMGNDEYLIRASIDSAFSFAGIFPSYETDIYDLEDNIIDCYKSIFSYNSLHYILQKKIDIANIKMGLILQEKIDADAFAYVTTINPVSSDTNICMITVAKNSVVENYEYNFVKNVLIKEDKYTIINKDNLTEVISTIQNLQIKFGYPLNIELAITKNQIYVLEATELINILHDNTYGLWEKASCPSKMFIYSLINNAYKKSLLEYNHSFGINNNSNLLLHFNSIYYNLTDTYYLLDKVINKETNYYCQLHNINKCWKVKKSLWKFISTFKNRKIHEKNILLFNNEYDNTIRNYQNLYRQYCQDMSKVGSNNIEKVWHRLVFDHYGNLFIAYTKLKIMNTLEKSILYSSLEKYLSFEEFNEVINVKERQYQYICQKEFYDLVKKINDNSDAYRYWYSSSPLKILDDYEKEDTRFYHPLFRHYINKYGYLSVYPMDLSHPFFVEDVEDVIRMIKKALKKVEDISDNKKQRLIILDRLQSILSEKKYNRLLNLINRLQTLIIAETYYYDYLIRFNFLVKRYTKMLAKYYLTKKIIDNENDIWHLSIDDIYNYIEGEVDSIYMRNSVNKHRLYYDSFRNYDSIKSFGNLNKDIDKAKYQGVGYSKGMVEGRIRIIKRIDELKTLTSDDILVTKTLNNNLLFQLPPIKGIILSDYNLSNNVKTLLRELDITCLYLEGCSHKLKDKCIIKMNVGTGKLKIIVK